MRKPIGNSNKQELIKLQQDGTDDKKKVMITARNRIILLILSCGICLYQVYQLVFTYYEEPDTFIGLLFMFGLYAIYLINFINLAYEESGPHIILYTLFGKPIRFKRIIYISKLPIISRTGSVNTVFLLTYINANEKTKKRLICVTSGKRSLLENVKKSLNIVSKDVF